MSIAFVFVQHSVSSTGDKEIERYTANFARLGVWIFFVISGFIITHLLLHEAERGPISLKQFYVRRALRLLPALFTFLLFLAVVQAVGHDLGLSPIHFVSSALFLVPYVPWGAENHPWSSGHLWSLAVEEHLIWPPLLAWLGARRAKWPLIALAITLPACRILWYRFKLDPLAESLIGIGDLMAYGALAAIWRSKNPEGVQRVLSRSPSFFRVLAVAAISSVMILSITRTVPVLIVPFGVTVVGLAAAYLLLSVCFVPGGWLVRMLNWPVIAWIGAISYSLYLWQQPFLHKYFEGAQWWQVLPANILLAVLAAVISHYLVERPFLKLKSKLKQR